MINSGKLNKKVIFQENKPIKTSSGLKDNWVDVTTVWASIEPLSSREYFLAQQANSEITNKIKVRYAKNIDRDGLRIIYNNKAYSLEPPINPDCSNLDLIFMAKVKSNEQHI